GGGGWSDVGGGREGPGRSALGVTGKRPTDCFDVGAILQRNAGDDRGVARVRVRCRVTLVIVEEDFAEPAIRESGDGAGITKAASRKLKRLGGAPGGEPVTGGGGGGICRSPSRAPGVRGELPRVP